LDILKALICLPPQTPLTYYNGFIQLCTVPVPLEEFLLDFPEDIGKIMDLIPSFNFPYSQLHFVVELL
jgi:hypothetical protein